MLVSPVFSLHQISLHCFCTLTPQSQPCIQASCSLVFHQTMDAMENVPNLQLHATQAMASCLCLRQEEWHLLSHLFRRGRERPGVADSPCSKVGRVPPGGPRATSLSEPCLCITLALWPHFQRHKHPFCIVALMQEMGTNKRRKWGLDCVNGFVPSFFFLSGEQTELCPYFP